MVGALHVRPHEGVDLGVALHLGAGRQLGPAEGIEGRLREDLARQAPGGAELLAVGFLGEVVDDDARRRLGDGRLQGARAAVLRAHRHEVGLGGVAAGTESGGAYLGERVMWEGWLVEGAESLKK